MTMLCESLDRSLQLLFDLRAVELSFRFLGWTGAPKTNDSPYWSDHYTNSRIHLVKTRYLQNCLT
jgi:hypothetical protein